MLAFCGSIFLLRHFFKTARYADYQGFTGIWGDFFQSHSYYWATSCLPVDGWFSFRFVLHAIPHVFNWFQVCAVSRLVKHVCFSEDFPKRFSLCDMTLPCMNRYLLCTIICNLTFLVFLMYVWPFIVSPVGWKYNPEVQCLLMGFPC